MKRYNYVYRIFNKNTNNQYIGVRTCKCLPKNDIGKKYFSSSSDNKFMEDQKKNNNNYIYEVIWIFKTRVEAIELEIDLHEYYNVGVNKFFYNKAKQTSTGFDTTGIPSKPRFGKDNPMYGKTHTPEVKRFLSKIAMGNKHRIGKKHTKETKAKLRKIALERFNKKS